MRAATLALLMLALPVAGAAAQAHLTVIAGIGGEAQYRRQFLAWSRALLEAARERWDVPDDRLALFTERPEDAPGLARGRSTRAELERHLAALAERTAPDATVVIVYVGHGSAQGGAARLSLPGPDLTAEALAGLLARLGDRRVVFAHLGSAGGDFVPALAGPNRVIISATKSGFERNETLFPAPFVEAFASDVADTDKDGRVSLLEAFEYARREVARRYESERRLRTEHALLEDDGDGRGAESPTALGGDGALAARTFLDGPGRVAGGAATDPAVLALLRRRDSIQSAVAELRGRKEGLAPEVYERRLEELLVALAEATAELRAREPKP